MPNPHPPTFSIIIPSYNEGDDIRLSIDSAIAQNRPPLEVLVVDDSSDRTPEIIREYADRGVVFVQGEHTSCCGARNLGMRRAKGDIIVLLNGDVALPPDFLDKIARHYEEDADYVLVESKVLNMDDYLARFIEAQHQADYAGHADVEWTEGFSARRAAAEAVGFIPGNYQARFCRDWMLGRKLKEGGFKKVVDPSIVVTHKSPAAAAEYWRVRVARGRFAALTQFYIYQRSRPYLIAKFILKDIIALIKIGTLIFPLLRIARLCRFSPRRRADFFPFLWAYLVQESARIIGEWQGFEKMQRPLHETN